MNGKMIWHLALWMSLFIAAYHLQDAKKLLETWALMGICIASIILLLSSSNPLRGLWVGPTRESMEQEIADLEALQHEWKYPDGSDVPMNARIKVMKRTRALYQALARYSDASR